MDSANAPLPTLRMPGNSLPTYTRKQIRRLTPDGYGTSHVSSDEYRVLMAWVYLKWISAMPPRRLEYSNTRLVTPAEYAASGKTENYIVMNKRGWTWNLHAYKTMEKYGVQILAVPGPLKAALNRIKPEPQPVVK